MSGQAWAAGVDCRWMAAALDEQREGRPADRFAHDLQRLLRAAQWLIVDRKNHIAVTQPKTDAREPRWVVRRFHAQPGQRAIRSMLRTESQRGLAGARREGDRGVLSSVVLTRMTAQIRYA